MPGPIDETDDGMFIDAMLKQSLKALAPIDMRFEVIFTVFKLKKPEKAF